VLSWLPRTRLGAVAAKELRLQWRDPRQRIGLFGLLAGPIAVVAIQGANTRAGLIPLFLASLPATTIATAAANLWGYDGARYWVQVAAPDDPRADLYGKVVARIITMGTITLGLLVVATLITRRPELYVPGLAFAVAGGGLVLGVAVPFSIITPVPLPEEAKNLFAGGRGGGSVAQILPTVLIIGLATGVLLPLGFLTAHFIDNVGALVLVGLLQVGIGVGSATIGMRLALRRLRHREPELLAALTRG
jgi:ABC-2 type transport system permease protein